MRGADKRTGELFSYVDVEKRVRPDHPLRRIREIVNAALDELTGECAALYSGPAVLPFRRRCCSGRCCCKLSTRSGRNGS